MQALETATRSALLDSLPSLQHGFTSLDTPKNAVNEFDLSTATAQQVHKAGLIWVDSLEKRTREADAIATFSSGLPVGVYSADCTPILVAAVEKSTNAVYGVMAVHGGWRSTALGIAESAFKAFALKSLDKGVGATRFVAAIGPCISYESFEVGPEVIEAFPHCEERGLARYLRDENGRRKYLFNLPGENLRQLECGARALGVELSVDVLGLCTLKLPERFPSYRRDGDKKPGRILSFLVFRG